MEIRERFVRLLDLAAFVSRPEFNLLRIGKGAFVCSPFFVQLLFDLGIATILSGRACGGLQMQNDDSVKVEDSLSKIKRVCSLINIALRAVLVGLCIYWLVAMILMCASFLGSGQFGIPEALNVILYISYDIVVAVMLVIFIRMFSDASKGSSPFKLGQVKSLRIVSAMLLFCVMLDFFIAANASLIENEIFTTGFYSTSENAIIQINFAPFIAAAVVFAFSFVFKYGVLLQEFSDETL